MEMVWHGSTLKINFPYASQPLKKLPNKPKPSFKVKVNNKEVPLKLVHQKTIHSPYKTFQIIPHSNVKNDKVEQFSDILADSFTELFERFKSGKINDPDRVFFETAITKDSYQTFITTNDEIYDTIKQQAQVTWKNVTLQEKKQKENFKEKDCLAYGYKLKYPFFLSLKTDKTMQQIPLEELLEISRFMDGMDKVFIQFGIQSAEEHWYKDAEKEREEFERKPPKRWIRKEFHKSTEMKPTYFGFDFTLRFIVQSQNERRKRRIARGLNLALKQLNQDNELKEKVIKPYRMNKFINKVTNRHISIPFIFGRRQILTPPEIKHFMKLPQRHLQDEYPIIETVTGKETDIPERIKKDGLALGEVTFKGKKHKVFMPTNNHDELCLPQIVIGSMGSGKTAGFGGNLLVESVKNGFGGLAIDPKDGQIRRELEIGLPEDKIIKIKFGEVPISLDWREVNHSSKAKNRLANTILSFFNTTTDETGAQTSRFLRAATMAMQTGKLSEVLKILEDKDYRTEVMEQVTNPIHKSTLNDLNEMSDGKRAQILSPIYNRLDVILGDEYLYECMESENGIDLVEITSQRKACIIDVPKDLLGKEGVEIIASLISTKLDLAMTLRKEKDRFPYKIVFDEPHQFNKSSKLWKSAAVESRYWKYAYCWMFHSWEQIPRDLAEIIKAAGPHYHLYPSSKKTFTDLAEEIAPFSVSNALKLKRFHAINIIRSGGEVVTPFIAKMAPPPSKNNP
ncbi:hypothetical protein [Oceanobacillus sp. Castelsardo]|uniref:hypothetical protein n=1 Tax=Oceanobacillus sp. Castelsardo TaxID=1851204 RepID=UPI0008384B1D|nr:hypothetical protein [Oceanobacillus sp. Castelsardo]